MENCAAPKICLTDEQQEFITKAKEGKNILVDACIGSGKTTTIQKLCCEYPEDKKILYLTYNKLLKLDAKEKIKNKNVTVTNYHGFAAMTLYKRGISAGVPEMIQEFNSNKPEIEKYDLLVLDEYQDIEQEFATMLEYIKSTNHQMQIVAVGDMSQKIYDKTTLNVSEFIKNFLGEHIKLEFTRCFRLSPEWAEKLGRIWNKKIIGENSACSVEQMNTSQVEDFLLQQEPKDILCLGPRIGTMSRILNNLEEKCPEKFNKKTVFASIHDKDSTGGVSPKKSAAIFTTYDSSKGLERQICVVFDYTEKHWQSKIKQPQQSYEILRNIFCVAASRGKQKIIFVTADQEELLSEKTLSRETKQETKQEDVDISQMFDFKYKENVEECFSLLKINCIDTSDDLSEINIKSKDALIDLSPCIGIYQEANFFQNYDIDKYIEHAMQLKKLRSIFNYTKETPLEDKILLLSFLETNQERYVRQVQKPLVTEKEKWQLVQRLSTVFDKNEKIQVGCSIDFSDKENGKKLFSAMGYADVVKNNTVYELKFVSELTHEHFLQCATYIVALELEKGVLWNTKKNEKYEIVVPNKTAFLNAVVKAITKGRILQYFRPQKWNVPDSEEEYFAVVDTETTFSDRVMSIGIVVSNDKSFQKHEIGYYILKPESTERGMYSDALRLRKKDAVVCTRQEAIIHIRELLNKYKVKAVFAYNAKFDLRHLPELSDFDWYDIMRLAAYKQHNSKIPENADCYSTGKLKRNFGVEGIMRLLTDNHDYYETHNALRDAMDELKIMKFLGYGIQEYSTRGCCISKERNTKTKEFISPVVDAYEKKQQECVNYEYVQFQKTQLPPKFQNQGNSHFEPQKNENTYSVKDVCGMLGKSQSYVYGLIRNGSLPAKKIKNKYYIDRRDYEDYVDRVKKTKIAVIIIAIILLCLYLFFRDSIY